MKKKTIIIGLLILMAVGVAYARLNVVTLGSKAGTAGAGWSCEDADRFCESFNPVGFDSSDWTLTDELSWGTSSIDPDLSITPFACDGAATQRAMRIVSGDSLVSADVDFTSSATSYWTFYLRIPSVGSITTATRQIVTGRAVTTERWVLRLGQNAGVPRLQLRHPNSAGTTITHDYVDVVLDTWFKVNIFWSGGQAENGIAFGIDDTFETLSDTSTISQAGSLSNVRFYISTLNSYTYDVNLLGIDTTAYPTCN